MPMCSLTDSLYAASLVTFRQLESQVFHIMVYHFSLFQNKLREA